MKVNCFTIIKENLRRAFYRRNIHCKYCSSHIESNSSFCNSCCELLEVCKENNLDNSGRKLVLNL